MKQYIGFSNDHSGSMSHIAKAAMHDFNATIAAVKEASTTNNIDTIVNVVQCGIKNGYGTRNHPLIINSNIQALKNLTQYVADGSNTPLFDSVGMLIDMLKNVPDYNDPEVTFLVFVTTDGGENSSRTWSGQRLAQEVKNLQNTDRWTFVFRVPRGNTSYLTRYGIPAGNIQEWDQTERGFQTSTVSTVNAFNDFYRDRSTGKKSTQTFYTSATNVSLDQVKAQLIDISSEILMWSVLPTEHGSQIRPYVEGKINKPMLKGSAFYQLTKSEKNIQANKMIVIREKATGKVYYGNAARQMIGLPTQGDVRVVPGDHGKFDVFVQSTSVNRILVGGTLVMYWPNVGKAFTEGPSYQPSTQAAVAAQTSQLIKPVPKTAPVAPAAPGKIRLIKVRDGSFVKEVNSVAEAEAEIQKARRNKKAALKIA